MISKQDCPKGFVESLRYKLSEVCWDLMFFFDEDHSYDLACDFAVDEGYGYCANCEPEPSYYR